MVRENQIMVDGDDETYVCIPCDQRYFSSEAGLLQHCRTNSVHRGEWCERCRWLFINPLARTTHIRDSSLHAVCPSCGLDAVDRDELSTHQSHVHKYCNDCQVFFQDQEEHRVKKHNACRECGEEFANQNNLTMHQQTHSPRTRECYGCTKKYAADSAIFDHLEYDTCPSGVTCAMIDYWAFECYQSHAYTNDWDDDLRYRCPGCNNHFKYISAMLRHAESPACDADGERCLDKMKAYISRKVYEHEESDSDYPFNL